MSIKKRANDVLAKEAGPLTFGMFMRVARNSLDSTQEEMAKIIGVSKSVICDIEKGRQLVSPTLAMKIARKAGLSEKLAVELALQDQLAKAKISYKVDLKDVA